MARWAKRESRLPFKQDTLRVRGPSALPCPRRPTGQGPSLLDGQVRVQVLPRVRGDARVAQRKSACLTNRRFEVRPLARARWLWCTGCAREIVALAVRVRPPAATPRERADAGESGLPVSRCMSERVRIPQFPRCPRSSGERARRSERRGRPFESARGYAWPHVRVVRNWSAKPVTPVRFRLRLRMSIHCGYPQAGIGCPAAPTAAVVRRDAVLCGSPTVPAGEPALADRGRLRRPAQQVG
jgi:hypothetical protein